MSDTRTEDQQQLQCLQACVPGLAGGWKAQRAEHPGFECSLRLLSGLFPNDTLLISFLRLPREGCCLEEQSPGSNACYFCFDNHELERREKQEVTGTLLELPNLGV